MTDFEREELYKLSIEMLETSLSEESMLLKTAEAFESLGDYNDSKKFALVCRENADIAKKNNIYEKAFRLMKNNNISSYNEAISLFNQIVDWKDSSEKINDCEIAIEEIKVKEKRDQIEKEKAIAQKKKKIKQITIISSICAVLFIVFIVVLSTVIIPSVKYNKAIDLINTENYINAYESLKSLGQYKDSKELMLDIEKEYLCEKIDVLNVNDTITIGNYENEDIEWIVVHKPNNGLLLLSKNSITNKAYNDEYEAVTWKNCTLRNWLNNEFYNNSFTETEKEFIKTTSVQTDISCFGYSDTIEISEDNVFIFSHDEFERYRTDDIGFHCYDFSGKEVSWWVRTYANYSAWSNEVFDVYGYEYEENEGFWRYGEHTVHNDEFTVRPVIWISVDQKGE